MLLLVQLRSVTIPELEALRVAHSCTIVTEMRTNMLGGCCVISYDT